MPVTQGYKDFITELMAPLGTISIRSMFGGASIYSDGLIFGLILDDIFFLKADASTIPAFEAEGMQPFSYGTKLGKHVLTSYWRMPERLFDETDEMLDWARKALTVARKAAAAKKPTRESQATKKTVKPKAEKT